MEKIKIAIIGFGFVGKAVAYGFDKDTVEQIHIDPILGTSIEELKGKDIYASFVCVPTPMGEDGSINASIVTDTIDYLMNEVSGLVILKSTVVPDIIRDINQKYDKSRFVYNPEFLTERNANFDFVNPIMHVFGCNSNEVAEQVKDLYENYSNCKKDVPIHVMKPEEASFVKYGINSFLATKVAWFNQYYDMINHFGLDYDTIREAIGEDDRVGNSHMKVPGPDGNRWFGGACFTKDTAAILKLAQKEGMNMSILMTAVTENAIGRSQYELDEREKAQNVNYEIIFNKG